MLKFLMVAEDVTITEEVLVVLVAEEVLLQEKEALHQEEGLVVDLEAILSPKRRWIRPRSSSAPRRGKGGFSSDRPRTRFI
jgi:hypothetical protein